MSQEQDFQEIEEEYEAEENAKHDMRLSRLRVELLKPLHLPILSMLRTQIEVVRKLSLREDLSINSIHRKIILERLQFLTATK